MEKENKDYFGYDRVLSLILAIIVPTSWFCGFVTRFQEGKILAGLIRMIFLGWNVLWIVDLVLMISKKHILRLINI